MTVAEGIATLGGIGRLRPAPGTWASALAVLAGVLIHRVGHFPALLAAWLVAVLVGHWAIRGATAGVAEPDRPEIVVDELCGQWLALLAPSFGFWSAGLPAGQFPWPGWLAAFVLFRLFDIWKPGPIGRIDRRRDAFGVMGDDLAAGLAAAVLTMVGAGLWHGVIAR